jgi:tetratricopeptide (TPR) repeat protein
MKKLIFFIIVFTSFVYAQNSISKKAFSAISKSKVLVDKKKYKKAKQLLISLIKESKNKYELSYLYQSLSSVYFAKDDYKGAIDCYEKIVKFKALDEKELDNLKVALSQLYLNQQQYKKSYNLAKSLEDKESIKKTNLYEILLYSSYYLENYKASIKYSKSLIALNTTKPKENYYRILFSSYIQIKDYKNAIVTMKQMLKLWNQKEDYWMQLSSLYNKIRANKKAISTLEIAFKKNIISKENNALFYVSLLLQNDLYIKSSEVLEKSFSKELIKQSFKNYKTYVGSLINAKEINKAISKIENSTFKNDSYFTILLAKLFYSKSKYKQSIETLKTSNIKDNKLVGEKYLLLALGFHELNKVNECAINLKKALRYKYTKAKAKSLIKKLNINI